MMIPTPQHVAEMLHSLRGAPPAAPDPPSPFISAAADRYHSEGTTTSCPAARPSAPEPPAPEHLGGCQYCDVPQAEHGTRYHALIGYHQWWAPDRGLLEQRRNAQHRANGGAR